MISHVKRQRAQLAAAVVGVDAGKFTHALVIRPRGQPDSKPFTFPTTRDGFEQADRLIRSTAGAQPENILVGIEFAGYYGFTLAHFLRGLGYQIVSVLPSATKAWKRTVHGIALKTDQKDALNITDLTAQGTFTAFPFLEPAYAELRYLVSARERLSLLRRSCVNRLRSTLQIVWPEFEALFPRTLVKRKTPLAILRAFPGPHNLLAAPKRRVLTLLRTTSRNHLGPDTYEQLRIAAERTLGLSSAQGALREEIPMLLQQLEFYEQQMAALEEKMVASLEVLPETPALLSIPGLAAVTAAAFLGSVGDPRAYTSGKEIIRLAGLTLTEHSSGVLRGRQRISKAGRPLLRKMAYMFAVRSVARGGIFRPEFDRLIARNGGNKMKAIVAVSRSALRLMYSIARDRRTFTSEAPTRGRAVAAAEEPARM